MKPDWKDAPAWAQYLAQDFNGEWFWYENKPYMGDMSDWVINGGRCYRAGVSDYEYPPEPRP